MRLQMRFVSCVLAFLFSTCVLIAGITEPFSIVPSEQREALSRRLGGYVGAYKGRKWEKLYEYVSDTGRGGTNQKVFIAAMKSTHGADFAQMPDFQQFTPDRTEKNEAGYDIYGCGKAQREGQTFNGIAVVHAVFEHQDWFFTGWTFTDFPNEPCKALSDLKWQPENRQKWNRPMEELANLKQQGVPIHVDASH